MNMQSKQYKIYILTSPRGLHYVGMTGDEPKIRWQKGYSKNTKIAKEIEQYGFDNFKKEILDFADTIEEAKELEAYYIEKYDCVNSGLNFLKSAYDNPYNYMKHTQETKDKISRLASARYKGSGNPMYNKHHRVKTCKGYTFKLI